MKKRLLSALLCVTMVAALLSGCGNQQKETEPENKPAEEQEQVDDVAAEDYEVSYPVVDEPITVKGLVLNNGRDFTNGRIVWDKVAEITGVNFEWIVLDKEAFSTYLAGGDWDFDFIHYRSLDDTLINDYGVEGGMFANYYDYLEYMPNLQQLFEDYPEAEKAVREINGEIYRLPQVELSATATQVRPYYRTDILEEAGLEVPTTVDEFTNVLKVLKEKNGGKTAWCPAGLDEASYWGVMLYAAFGTSVTADFDDDGNGNVIYNRTSEQYKHYLEYMNMLYEEKLIDQEYLTVDGQYTLALAQAGETAFFGGEAHSLTEADFSDGVVHLDVMAPLTSEYDSTQTVLAQLPVSKNGFFLNAESENLVPLVKALDIMFAVDEVVEGSGLNGESFTYGMEGEHYVLNADGTYETVTPEGYDGSFTDFQYNELIIDNAGRATALEGYVTATAGNGQARQLGFKNNVFPYACDNSEVFPSSFLKFTSEEQSVITNKFTDIQSYVNEMKSKFITGVEDIDTTWDEYVQGLEDRGLSDVLEVYQAAYDRWNQ